ncbi:MAG: sulfatase-like hydrolase/transferase [Vicinamibacterales bacterium]
MRSPALLLAWLALTAGCSAPPGLLTSGAARGRNVLLVTIDTLRRDRVGAYGHPGGLTPALDRLAAEGVRFTAATSHAPLTLPAHASMLTGRVPPHHGLRVNGAARLGDDVPTLATVLHDHGYRTGAFVGAFVLDRRYGLARGFDVYDDRYPQAAIGRTFGFAERRGDAVVDVAGAWIDAQAAGTPWFAWVHLYDPHAPYEPPAEFASGRAPYDGEIAYADAMLGRLIARLQAARRFDDTLIVVTADHGESLGAHGESTHGLFAYDETLAVPLVLRGPGVGRGTIDAPVGHDDLMPTVLDLAGVPPPAGIDGMAASRGLPADRAIYFEALEAHLTRDWAPLTGVTDGRWKYVDLPEAELYDRQRDAAEHTNLVASETGRVTALDRARRPFLQAPTAAPAATGRDADRRLRALGYVSGSASATAASRTYTAADDPKRLVALHERFTAALDAFGRGRADAAIEALTGVLAARPDFAVARTTAATVLASTGRMREAIDLLRAAPVGTPQDADVQAKLGAILSAGGDAAGAVAALEGARAAGVANPELRNDLGVAYARLGRAADARAQFDALLAIDPDDASAASNLGLLELSAGRGTEAAAAFRRAVASDPDRAEAWQGLGAALVASDRGAAIDAWMRAERLAPRDFDLLYNLGMILAGSGRQTEATPYLQRFVREAPPARYGRDIAQVRTLLQRSPR